VELVGAFVNISPQGSSFILRVHDGVCSPSMDDPRAGRKAAPTAVPSFLSPAPAVPDFFHLATEDGVVGGADQYSRALPSSDEWPSEAGWRRYAALINVSVSTSREAGRQPHAVFLIQAWWERKRARGIIIAAQYQSKWQASSLMSSELWARPGVTEMAC
jgi:hypothetical protein